MLFITLSASMIGFATLAVAAPHTNARIRDIVTRSPNGPVDRGIIARANRNNIVKAITITQTTDTIVQDAQTGLDVELVQQIQKKLVVIDNTQQFKDNVRRNTFRNKNTNQNTVVIIVTQVIDQRDVSNTNTRYLTRQIESNQGNADAVYVVVSEAKAFTIAAQQAVGTGTAQVAAQSTGSAQPVQQFATYDPNALAQLAVSNSSNQQILPVGAAAPTWANAQTSEDPALILEAHSQNGAFVAFVGEDLSQTEIISQTTTTIVS